MKCDIKGILRPGLILLATALVMCYSIGIPAIADMQYSDRTGAIAGRVSTPDGSGVGGAYVALVSAYDPGVEIYNTTSDAYGNYQIVGVRNTQLPNGTIDNAYMMHAKKSPYGEGYSMPFGVDPDSHAYTTTSVVLFPAISNTGIGPQTVWSDMGKTGKVTGRVTTATNGTVGIGGAYIALVDARTGREYYNTTSDAYGNYQMVGVNATYSSWLGEGPEGTADTFNAGHGAYQIYANKTPYGEGYSAAFGIDADQVGTTPTSVIILAKPAALAVTAGETGLRANGADHTTISAYMTDVLGNPIADGYTVRFHMGTDKKGMGQFAEAGGSAPAGSADVIVQTRGGYATVEFGWMTKAKKSNAITASLEDDPSVQGTIAIHSTLR